MDADGTRSKSVARSLRKLGTKASIKLDELVSFVLYFMPVALITQNEKKEELLNGQKPA